MKIIRVLSKRVTGKKLLLPILMMSACTSTETLEPDLSLFRENAQPINISIDNEGSLPIVVNIVGKARDALFVENAMTEVTAIYEQCQIPLKTRLNKLSNSESEELLHTK